MRQDIILAGVGGQGILVMARVLILASQEMGFYHKQPEVHGMSQRGGPVYSDLRFSDSEIWSDLIPQGQADIILGIEPMEALRYSKYLSPDSIIISSNIPIANIPNYPEIDLLIDKIKSYKNHILLDAKRLAKEAGSEKAQNIVVIGAASPYLIMKQSHVKNTIKELFSTKGERIVEVNLKAFEYGLEAAGFYRQCIEAGISTDATYALSLKRKLGDFDSDIIAAWKEVFELDSKTNTQVLTAIKNYDGFIPMRLSIPQNIKKSLKPEITEKHIKAFLSE